MWTTRCCPSIQSETLWTTLRTDPATALAGVMIQHLPAHALSHDDQQQLAHVAAFVTTALDYLKVAPANRRICVALLLGLAAERQLWMANLRLVMHIAYREHARGHGDIDELFQEGALALQRSIRMFRPERGFRLSTYAHHAITRRMRHVEVNDHYLHASRHFQWRRQVLLEGESEDPRRHHAFIRRVPLDEIPEIADDRDDLAHLDQPSIDFLDLLDERHSMLLRMRFGIDTEPMSQQQVARHFGVSNSSISRWEREALAAARKLLQQDFTTGTDAAA